MPFNAKQFQQSAAATPTRTGGWRRFGLLTMDQTYSQWVDRRPQEVTYEAFMELPINERSSDIHIQIDGVEIGEKYVQSYKARMGGADWKVIYESLESLTKDLSGLLSTIEKEGVWVAADEVDSKAKDGRWINDDGEEKVRRVPKFVAIFKNKQDAMNARQEQFGSTQQQAPRLTPTQMNEAQELWDISGQDKERFKRMAAKNTELAPHAEYLTTVFG